ncbi:unnamed protein product [Rotaria magnacalcarata]|uniref:ABC transporter domain-containing protein n=1 Tax=Rotaria magnacalcarata TaxID=392030 RepID=A0A8S2MIV7_9BILA|nr:unnamed protein product [Rotaria magnacalcarata]
MLLYHLWLLIQKSLRYAWRCRSCRYCPKIIFELLVPLICILFLILIRWIHTKSKQLDETVSLDQTRPSNIELNAASTISQNESMRVFNYTSMNECPPPDISIEIVSKSLFNRFKHQCPQSSFDLTEKSKRHNGNIILNNTANGSMISYRCRYDNGDWCHNNSVLKNEQTPMTVQHPSLSLCSSRNIEATSYLLRAYLATASLLNPPPPTTKKSLSIYSWPCSSYVSDQLFQMEPAFTLITIFIFIDGCILYSFNLLFHSLIDEKHQGITELLRLISIRPILNSFAWLLRIFIIQLIPNISLILILKLSFEGGIYLSYVSIWLIIPTIILWSIQVLSRAILVGHFFSSNLKASLWSWFIYVVTFWLAVAPPIRLSPVLHLIASAWLPFYSIKRLMIILFRINNDLGRTHLTSDVVLIWFYMLLGSLLMWLLAYYFEQVRPGKYGIPRPWSWPLDYFFNNPFRTTKQRQSIDMQMVETLPDVNTTVRINNLTKTYGRFNTEQQLAVDHISFKLQKSIIHGLIGHNGAGKTSVMEMMCGIISCNCGTIEIHNKDLHENLDELKQCIGYCPQQDMLFPHLTVREQLEFYARIRSKGHNVDYNQIKELLTMMDMNQYRHRLCHTLSGGMQRKLSILCAFVGQATVIILDEPSSSLDPAARRVLWSWLQENKTNRTLLISSHLLDEVEELCDSIIILDAGKIRAQGTVLELKQQFGSPGDRLHLDKIPAYIPTEWIIDEKSQFIQVPNRQQLISLLEKLEQDSIKYSLENVTLDEIFLKLTSSTKGLSSVICAALIIQDHSSGFHSYSLIHGLRSPIHWAIVFLSDLVLCLIWTLILILIERFVHSSTFNGRFFALAPLLFIGDLPFIYLIAKLFKSPILGATIIVFILQLTHFFYTFRVIIEFFRGRHAITTIIHFFKWTLVIIFPNINVFTLMVTILRPYSCSMIDSPLDNRHFSNEHYPHKLLIHTLILIGQFIFYFILLIFIDTWKLPIFGFYTRNAINQQEEEDNDVTTERQRIETMNHEEKQNEAVIIDNISKYYHCSVNPAVNRLTLAVPHRECFGLLGFNGSGKTTTFRMLVGELQPSHGHIYKNNRDLIGYCPQDDITFSALTVLKSIDYICRIHGLNPSSINNLLLSQFQLEKYRHRLISHLSGGTRRRLHLALCLIGSPTLLLLDEPTAKVDPLIRSHIRLILQNRPVDTSIVFASHSMLECEQLCDRLTILVHGNARCLGSPRHLKNKYGNDYRIRLTLLQSAFDIPLLQRVDNTNEYTYPKNSLSNLFKILEDLVALNIIASNYTVQLTSLEHIFLGFQHTLDAIV